MNGFFGMLRDELVIAHSQVGSVDQPAPNFGGPGVAALQTISGVLMALALVALIVAGIAAASMIAYGHFARHGEAQSRGLKGVVMVIVAAIVLGSIAGLVNWGTSVKAA